MKKLILYFLLSIPLFSIAQDPNGTPVSTPHVLSHSYFIYIYKLGVDPIDANKVLWMHDSTDMRILVKKIYTDSIAHGWTNGRGNYLLNSDTSNGMIGISRWDSIPILWSNIISPPLIPTNTNQLTNGAAFITGINSGNVTTALGYTPSNPNGTNLQYTAGDGSKIIFPSIPSAQVNSDWNSVSGVSQILNKPTIPTNTNQLTNGSGFITGITSGNVTTALGYTPINPNGSASQYFKGDGSLGTTATSLPPNGSAGGDLTGTYPNPTLTTSGVSAGAYNGTITVDAKGRVTAANNASFNNAPSHSIVTVAAAANGFQVSATKLVLVSYSVKIVSLVQIGVATNVEGYVVLEVAATNSSTASDWAEIGRVSNGQNIGLALALSSTQSTGLSMSGVVPSGYYTRLRSVNVSGVPTYSFISGQETTL